MDRCIYGQKGFESSTFQEVWEVYAQYQSQKDSPEKFSDVQRERIQKAYSSVKRWLNTPVTHITLHSTQCSDDFAQKQTFKLLESDSEILNHF